MEVRNDYLLLTLEYADRRQKCTACYYLSFRLQELIKRLSLTVLIQECISSGEIGFGEFGSMEEVASLRPVSLIYLSYMPDSIFHFCLLTRFNLPVKSTISGKA